MRSWGAGPTLGRGYPCAGMGPGRLHPTTTSLWVLVGPSALFSRCLHTASWQQACSSAN